MTAPPVVAARVLEYFTGAPAATTPAFPELTEREREILERIASGANNARIAQQLGFSVKTVRNHSSNIFTKLHVSDRAQAIVRAATRAWAIDALPDVPAGRWQTMVQGIAHQLEGLEPANAPSPSD